MVESYIDQVIRRICNREGGFVNDPNDAGGPTKYGITQATLEQWRKAPVSAKDVKELELQEACMIYKRIYVERPGFLLFNDEPLAEQLIDAGVNHGTNSAVRLIQSAVGAKVDGILGTETKSKYNTIKPAWKVFTRFMSKRLRLYAQILSNKPSQVKFAAGWMNRCVELMDLYVLAVSIDQDIETKILQVSGDGRRHAKDIQKTPSVRKESARLFRLLSRQLDVI